MDSLFTRNFIFLDIKIFSRATAGENDISVRFKKKNYWIAGIFFPPESFMLEKVFKAHAKTGYLVTMSGAIEMVALSYEKVSGSIPMRGCTDL